MNNFNYTDLPPFKWFVLENFPYIEADFDALTNWQLFCKLGEEMNKIIEKMNLAGQQTEDLTKAFNELKNYINNYFENLDVQNEINNKLDEMVEDGTFYNIINKDIFTNINNKVLQNSQNIGELNNKVDKSIKTTDTNIITEQMLTQEVKELMTGGSTAVVGLNSINTDNINDNVITIFKLDKLLKNNFIKEYNNINLDFKFQGYCGIGENNKLKITSDNSNYSYSVTNLEKDKIYDFAGFNQFNILLGLVVVDSQNDNEVVYSTYKQGGNNIYSVSTIFRPNKEGLIAYISTSSYFSLFAKNNVYLNEISNISLNYLKNNVNEIKTVYNALMSISTEIGKNPVNQAFESEDYFYKIYKLSKGTKYKIKSFNVLYIAGLVITDENLITTYSSSTTPPEKIEYFEYEFIAQNDGFAFLSFYKNASSLIEILNDFNNQNRFINKKWVALGDSLTDIGTLGINVDNYVNYVSNILNINFVNLGIAGSGYKAREGFEQAFYQKALTIPNDTDVITIFGSFNDIGKELGNITDNTTETICGCMNKAFDNIMNNYPNAVLGVIIPTPWELYSKNNIQANNYVNALIDICKYRSIPYLDLFHHSNLFPYDESFKNKFYLNADGVHPNTLGHKKFAPQIANFINSILY